jgi:hypothetical protein
LEEELATSRLEADELCSCLNDLEDHHETLSRAALDAMRVVRPEGHLLPDCLRSLPRQVRDAVVLAVCREAASALALTRVQSGWDLAWLEPGFLMATSPQELRALMNMFARAAAIITMEVNVDDILTRGADPGQGGA